MRVFIAIDIDENIREMVTQLQHQLRADAGLSNRDVKWVEADNIHITLKFLGEVKDTQLRQVCDIVADVAQSHSPFDISVEGLGYFGGKSARVLWVGLTDGGEKLTKLAEQLDEKLSNIGFAKETKRFTGHLTLCRIKDYKAGIKLAGLAENYGSFKAGVSFVESIVVYQSQLDRTGPTYTALGTYQLRR